MVCRARWASLLLAALIVITVMAGLGSATGLLRSIAGKPALWIHIAVALVLVPLALWHILARRIRPRLPVSDFGRLLLATRVGGAPLSTGHGYPLRLVAPGRRGYWWVKWVDHIELQTTPWWWQPPFPVT